MSEQTSAAININLNGEFVIPVDGVAPVAGSVSGDLRLAVLDAFIQNLDGALVEGGDGAKKLASVFRKLMRKMDDKTLVANDVVLAVTCTTDPATHSMTHSFRLAMTPKPE